MKTLYIECSMGAAGDMLMAALYELLDDKQAFLDTMNRLGLQAHPGEPQAVHGIQKPLLVLQQFIQGGHEHVPGGPHIAFQIKRFHFIPPDLPFD